MNGPNRDWDINDSTFTKIQSWDDWVDWPDGHCRYVYHASCEEAKKHSSGWAMRNTNNHNVNILKKSCLGVLVCSKRCLQKNGKAVSIRPAICDKARKKQQGKLCPNSLCDGILEIQPCRGHCGYPVTHFWRHVPDFGILFQAKGYHDHSRPASKSITQLKIKNGIKKASLHSGGSTRQKKIIKMEEHKEESLYPNNEQVLIQLDPGYDVDKPHDLKAKKIDYQNDFRSYFWPSETIGDYRRTYDTSMYSPCEPANSSCSNESIPYDPSLIQPVPWETPRLPFDPKQQQQIPDDEIQHQPEVPSYLGPESSSFHPERESWANEREAFLYGYPEQEGPRPPSHFIPPSSSTFDLSNPGDIFQLEKSIEYDYSAPYDFPGGEYNGLAHGQSEDYDGLIHYEKYDSSIYYNAY